MPTRAYVSTGSRLQAYHLTLVIVAFSSPRFLPSDPRVFSVRVNTLFRLGFVHDTVMVRDEFIFVGSSEFLGLEVSKFCGFLSSPLTVNLTIRITHCIVRAKRRLTVGPNTCRDVGAKDKRSTNYPGGAAPIFGIGSRRHDSAQPPR